MKNFLAAQEDTSKNDFEEQKKRMMEIKERNFKSVIDYKNENHHNSILNKYKDQRK